MKHEEFIKKIQELNAEMKKAYDNNEITKANDIRVRQIIMIDLYKAGKI